MSHACPCGCARQIADERLLCGPSWRRVPESLRRAVWNAYRNRGNNPGHHREVCRMAVDYINKTKGAQRNG